VSKNVVVTGGSGGVGSYVVRELLEHDYDVLILDRVSPEETDWEFRKVDLTDYRAVQDAMSGRYAAIHFASNPEPDFDFVTGADRFRNNTLCTYNVFNAACALGMEKVVWASSETVLGFPFDVNRPVQVPVVEDDRLQPRSSYAISKVMCETAAAFLHQLYGVHFLGLQLSNVLHTGSEARDNYEKIPSYWEDPFSRKFNLWGYIDARDAARCARLALESDVKGAENFIVAAADTIMCQTNTELIETVFPGVPILPGTGDHQSMLSSAKAGNLLGWSPRWSWRDILA
jgi:nucleoside-diphosphate-sugar epimerase